MNEAEMAFSGLVVSGCKASGAFGFVEAASLFHTPASFCVVEDPLLPGNILLTLVHHDTPCLFDQDFRSVIGRRINLQLLAQEPSRRGGRAKILLGYELQRGRRNLVAFAIATTSVGVSALASGL